MTNGEKIFSNLKKKYYTEGRTDKFKILFCPYKQEMWDSMSTIYKAAKSDYDTLTEIMPIPYFTLQNVLPKNLRLDFEHHRDNFPSSLSGEKWDIIIFHYPYDKNNNITRPLILSSDLKHFCKHLVLVEYFVIGNRMPSDTELNCPGVKIADLVVYETEEQAEYAQQKLRGKTDTECVGWGSAKYDLVTEVFSLPSDWKEKINGRKVSLLQTSIVPYLNNPHKLEQIESIISKYENNNGVCLIWRPHPLFRDTIIAHSPHNLKKFDLLVERMTKSDKDIFDNTELAERTMSIADEMISDRSSLTILWEKTGKKLTRLER